MKILAQVPFFAGLPIDNLEKINQYFHERGYTPEEIICFAEDHAEYLHVIAEGKVKLIRHSMTGKDVLLDILSPGEFFGSTSAQEDDVYADTAQPQTPVCILMTSVSDFRHILDSYPSVALKVLDITSRRLRAANEKVRQLSAYTVEQRIAHTLLILSDKLGSRSEVGLLIQSPLSRTDIAALTGTTTETASRVMSQFQKSGLIRTGREWVAVTNRDELEAITEKLQL